MALEKSSRLSLSLDEIKEVNQNKLPERLKASLGFETLVELRQVLDSGMYEITDAPVTLENTQI